MQRLTAYIHARFLLLLFVFFILSGCNSANNYAEELPTDAALEDSVTMGYDTATTDNNSEEPAVDEYKGNLPQGPIKMERPAPEDSMIAQPMDKGRSGILGWSYFKEMKQHETRNITAYVKITNVESVVLNKLEYLNESDIPPVRKSDTASMFTRNILLYKYLDVSLVDPDSDFKIEPLHTQSKQLIDTINGNAWQWAVTPKTSKKEVRLTLRAVPIKANGQTDPLLTRTIPITINLEYNFFRKVWSWLMDNPESLLVLLIIPLVKFVIGLFSKKSKADSNS